MNAVAAVDAGTERSAKLAFATLCIGHLVLWTLIPSLMYECVPRDTLEGIVWGRQWLLGYDKHPFLAPWISAFVTDLFGTVGWPVYLASQISIATCFWAVWMLARTLFDPWRAFVAVAVLEGLNYYNISSFTFNPNMAMLATWAMLTFTLHRAVSQPRLGRWLHVGLWAGLALLAKYQSVVLFIALLIPLLTTGLGQQSLRTPGPYVAAILALAVASPNLLWLAQHDFIALRYATGALGLDGAPAGTAIWDFYVPLKFLLQQFGALIPVFLLFLLFPRRWAGRINLRDFDQSFVLAAAVGPLVIAIAIAIVTGAMLYTHWAFPFFSFLGVALVMFLPPVITPARLKRFGAALAGLTLLLAGILFAIIFVRPHYSGKPAFSITFPSRTLSAHVTEEWRRRFKTPLPWVAGERFLVAGVSAYSQDKPKPFFNLEASSNPWWDEASMQASGAALVARVDGAEAQQVVLEQWRAHYPGLTQVESIELPQLSAASLPQVRFLIGYLPPQEP